jgi:hypothetical protein
MSAGEVTFAVTGTGGGVAWIPVFGFSYNNLNPRVVARDEALSIRIVVTTTIPYPDIRSVRNTFQLFGHGLEITAGMWSYTMSFRSEDERQRLRDLLVERGVAVT